MCEHRQEELGSWKTGSNIPSVMEELHHALNPRLGRSVPDLVVGGPRSRMAQLQGEKGTRTLVSSREIISSIISGPETVLSLD